MIEGFVSLKKIFGIVYRDLDLNTEIAENDMYEWGAEALQLIGAYSQYDVDSKCIPIVDGKARLPLGFHKIVDITYNKKPMYWATNTAAANYACKECNINVCNDRIRQNTFYINNSYLITNIDEADQHVCINYLRMMVDDEGYPMIPDDVYYSKAVSSYIIHKNDYREWRKGKLPDKVFDKSEREWLFYVNSAKGKANMPNIAQLENLKNIMIRLMPLQNEYGKGFVNMSKQEQLDIGTRNKWSQ